MSKKILFISRLFYPSNQIGALRPSKICKFLLEKGYCVDVITEYTADDMNSLENCRIISVKKCPKENIESGTARTEASNRLVTELKRARRTKLSYEREKIYAAKVLEMFECGELNASDYDACFTTFGPISSVLIGLKLKSEYGIKNWICDFRDPMVVPEISVFFKNKYRKIQNECCKKADKIVAVSNGYIGRICGKSYAEKSFMIPNGFDITDKPVYKETEKHRKLSFTYVGALYEGKRDISPLFKAVSELFDEGIIDKNEVEFVYAGKDFFFFEKQAEKYCMNDCLSDMGQLDRVSCLALQQNSDFLILSTWNNKGEEGVFPGKFIEYMLFEKPVVALVGGTLSNSEVKLVMEEGNFGITYEQANNEADYKKLKEYLKNCFDFYRKSGEIPFSPSRDTLDKYNYTSIMKKMEDLINK